MSAGWSADRRVALGVTGAALVGLLAVALWQVPWRPVPGGPLVPPAPGQVFSPAELARGEHYAWWARVWSWGGLAVSLAVLSLVGFTSRGGRLVRRVPGPWWSKVVGGTALVVGLSRLATLPFAVAGRRHARENGLSDQPWTGFARDQLVSWGVSVVTLSVVLLVVVGAARRWTRAWPAAAAAMLALLVLGGSFAYPVLVEPLFNRFTPLPESRLRTEVLALADREGVHVDDVLVADASRRTTTLNAYVSGFGSTRRVVLYDTLVADLPEDQALTVVAHELAHARHRDVVVGSVLGAWGAALAVGLLGLAGGVPGVRRAGRPGVGSVPALVAAVALGSVLVGPAVNLVSRHLEARADVDALRATGDGPAFVALQRRLALRSLADPTPPRWSQLWFGSHPTVLERVAIADRIAGGEG